MPQGICPHCGSPEHDAVSFSWWGGLLGPKLFNHVKCRGCGKTFNSKTGRTNDTGIAIYLVVGGVVGIALFFFLFRTMFSSGF